MQKYRLSVRPMDQPDLTPILVSMDGVTTCLSINATWHILAGCELWSPNSRGDAMQTASWESLWCYNYTAPPRYESQGQGVKNYMYIATRGMVVLDLKGWMMVYVIWVCIVVCFSVSMWCALAGWLAALPSDCTYTCCWQHVGSGWVICTLPPYM